MKRFVVVFSIAIVLTGTALGARAAWESSALQLQRVEVGGNTRVSKEEIVRKSGLTGGVHLLTISPSGTSKRIESIPWIANARVERVIPSTVRIIVEERLPQVVVVIGGGAFLVDSEGVVLERGSDAAISILELPVGQVRPGQRISSQEFSQSLAVLRAIPAAVGSEVRFVRAASVETITLDLRGGESIVYGPPEYVGEKNFALTALLADAGRRGESPAVIDVRVPGRPAMRLR